MGQGTKYYVIERYTLGLRMLPKKLRSVDFYLTKSCNKTCHYCTAWTKEMRNLEVDIDYVDWLLSCFEGHEVAINLLGGEPALVKNLDAVLDTILKYPNLRPTVLSNSLIRKRYPYILEDSRIFYREHLILDIHEDHIEKLGPKSYDFFPENDLNNYNVIIKTPGFMKWGEKHGLNRLAHNNTEFKNYNSRSPTFSATEQSPEFDRRMCAAFPKVPVIDFEAMKIRHCSKKVINGSRHYDITRQNIQDMLNYELFRFEEYCMKCMDPIDKREKAQILKIMEAGKV